MRQAWSPPSQSFQVIRKDVFVGANPSATSRKNTSVEMAMEIAAIFLCIVSVSDQNVPDTMLCKWDVYRYIIRPGEDSLSPQVWKLAPSVTCGHHGDDECPLSFRSREETEVLSPRVSQVHDIVSIIQLATCPRPPLMVPSPGAPLSSTSQPSAERLKTVRGPWGGDHQVCTDPSSSPWGPLVATDVVVDDEYVIVSGKQNPESRN